MPRCPNSILQAQVRKATSPLALALQLVQRPEAPAPQNHDLRGGAPLHGVVRV